MNKKQEKEQKLEELTTEFERVSKDNEIDIESFLATREHIPDLGEIEIYEYEKDLDDAKSESVEYMEELADLFLGDDESVRSHPYIVKKIKEDSEVVAQTKFLQNMTVRNCITQLRQIDNGDNSARMHEVVNQTISQMRENIKFSQTQRTDIEGFYKDIRKDLGLRDMSDKMEETSNKEEGNKRVVGIRELNDLIKNNNK